MQEFGYGKFDIAIANLHDNTTEILAYPPLGVNEKIGTNTKHIEIELPGWDSAHVHVTQCGNKITVVADEQFATQLRHRPQPRRTRTFTLADNISVESVVMFDGLLVINFVTSKYPTHEFTINTNILKHPSLLRENKHGSD